MAAYAAIIRENTRNATKLEDYRKMAPASFEIHPASFFGDSWALGGAGWSEER
jgi:hypothetical protein